MNREIQERCYTSFIWYAKKQGRDITIKWGLPFFGVSSDPRRNAEENAIIFMSSDILTIILIQFLRKFCCSLFSLVKNNRERKKKSKNKNIM